MGKTLKQKHQKRGKTKKADIKRSKAIQGELTEVLGALTQCAYDLPPASVILDAISVLEASGTFEHAENGPDLRALATAALTLRAAFERGL